MNEDQMLAYARAIAGGAKIKNDEVRAFMRALVADHEASAAQANLEASPSMPLPPPVPLADEMVLVAVARGPATAPLGPTMCPIELQRTDSGIHLGPEANRDYNWREIAGLIGGLSEVLASRP